MSDEAAPQAEVPVDAPPAVGSEEKQTAADEEKPAETPEAAAATEEKPAEGSTEAEEKAEPETEEKKAKEGADAPPAKTQEQIDAELAKEKLKKELAEKEEEARKANWGGWGALPAELEECGEVERPALPLLDELKKSDDPHDVEGIVGPDGFEYPPLTAGGADILKRLWANELPPNREQTVQTWDKRVRNAKEIGLTIPAPPRVPATAVLNRKAAERKANTNTDISKWAVAEEPEIEESEEIKEFREKGIVPETVSKMLEKRFELRAAKEYREADRIKEDLFEMQVQFNDQTRQWKTENHEGTFLGGPEAAAEARRTDKPIEIQDIDMPGSWEDFLALQDPKVLTVGPRGADGKRAWGAGGHNWGVTNLDAAYQQAIENCRNQGVHRPKIIYPPLEPGQKGGKGFDSYGGGKGGKGGKGNYHNDGYNNNYNNNNYGGGNYNNSYNSGGRYGGGKGYGQSNYDNSYGGKGQNWGGKR